MEISLCMIVKNEEAVLGRCLQCVEALVEEIIIVDTGSTDDTIKIAEQYGAKIFHFEWRDDFGAARNYAFEQATKDYIFWLDADDYITQDDIEKFKVMKETLPPTVDVVNMDYSLSRNEKGETIFSLKRNRIVKRSMNCKWIGRIHEYLEVYGNTYAADIAINHDKHKEYTNRNLRIFRQMEAEGAKFTLRDVYYFANELYYNGLYEEAINRYMEFLSQEGWIEDRKAAVCNLLTCFNQVGTPEKKKDIILESFKWGKPRGDICCAFAEEFFNKGAYEDAIFWYKIAMMCAPKRGNMGQDFRSYYTWIPAIQLCVCYSKLEDYYSSYYYNELCARLGAPEEKVTYNRNYLGGKFNEKGIPLPEINTWIMDSAMR